MKWLTSWPSHTTELVKLSLQRSWLRLFQELLLWTRQFELFIVNFSGSFGVCNIWKEINSSFRKLMSSLSPPHRFPLGFQKMKQKRNMKHESLFPSSPTRVFFVCVVGCRKLGVVKFTPNMDSLRIQTRASASLYGGQFTLLHSPHRPHQFLLVCVTRGKRQGAWQKRYNSFLLSHARPIFSILQSVPAPLLAPLFLMYNVWFHLIFCSYWWQTSRIFSLQVWLIIEKARFQARTAATVWNWSGKTLSPGTLLLVLYFSSRPFFSARLATSSPGLLPV